VFLPYHWTGAGLMPDAPLTPAGGPPQTAAAHPTSSPDLTGRTLGDYQLLRRLGVGGMGQVYLARQLSLKRDVAIKLLRDDLAANITALKRFEAEAQAVARLNHANIVHIHQIGECDGLRFMALEYVEGRNLRDHLARKGPPDLPISLSIMRQVALALQNAHNQGIVHRDIKPENILVTRKVEVKVTDFGLSRFFAGQQQATHLTQSGVTMGTPLYMSPEQVQGQPVDHRSDIYSFGVTSYHLLAGEPPFRGATAFDVALKHVQEEPRPLAELRPDLPADLCAIVQKMMAKNPDARYQSARDIIRDLNKVRDGIAIGLSAARSSPPADSQGQCDLSRTLVEGQPAGAGSGLAVATVGQGRQSIPWSWWLFGAVACLAALTGGVLAYAALHPAPEDEPSPTAPSVGLPDIRLPDKIITTRERQLIALLASRDTRPDDYVTASIELGLLYLHEKRLDDAEQRFQKLEREQFDKQPLANRTASVAGRLGQAICLAYRDQKDAAERSNELVLRVLSDPFPKFGGKSDKLDKDNKGFLQVASILIRQPSLAQALAEALNRNAALLGKVKLEPPMLEWLRSPLRTGKQD
jgi:serine/threonine-protein kinase